MKIFSKSKLALRASALLLILLLLLPSLIACQSGLSKNTQEVGKVGKYSVPYEEFYLLAQSHYNTIKDDYKNDPQGLEKAVWKYVNENICANYVILAICEDEGLVYDEEALADDVDNYIDNVIIYDFDGDEDAYYDFQEEQGFTDHYTRFVAGVDILYSRLADKYKESGLIPNTDKKLVEYIKNNFIHTCHITIFINSDEEKEAKRAKAEEALAKLESGEYDSVANMLRTSYHEDITPVSSPYDGEYFPRGIMDKPFEDAAFALGVGEHSGIVEGTSKNMNGEYVDCFFIIERLKNNTEEIDANLHNLTNDVTASVFYEKIEATKAELSFKPNEYAKSLDIHDLDSVEYSSMSSTVTFIIVGAVAIAIMVAIVVVVRIIKKKRFKKSLNTNSLNAPKKKK